MQEYNRVSVRFPAGLLLPGTVALLIPSAVATADSAARATFVGFIIVALVGGAAETASAFSGARRNRLDLAVGIALGSASQTALFVVPVLVQ